MPSPPRRLRALLALGLVCLACSLSGRVRAQAPAETPAAPPAAPPPGYKALIDEALGEYRAKNYPEARVLFTEAHEQFPSARTLRGLGMVAFELRSYRESIGYLEQALASKVRPLDLALRARTDALLTRAYKFVARLRFVLTPPETHVLVDGNEAAVESGGAPLLLDQGDHVITFEADGHVSESRPLKVVGREVETWTVALHALPPPPPLAAPALAEAEAKPSAPPTPREAASTLVQEPAAAQSSIPTRSERAPGRPPLYKNPWLWTGVGAAVITAVAVGAGVAASRDTVTRTNSPILTGNAPADGVGAVLMTP